MPGSRAAIWIKPTGAARAPCRDAVEFARAHHGGPRFEPHITLLGGIALPQEEAQRRLKQLASRVEPFTLQLQRAALGNAYFQRLFVRAELTPELAGARRLAETLFDGSGPFEPHLSLMYGDQDLDPSALEGFASVQGLSFVVESLHLVQTGPDLPPERWRELAEYTLRPIAGTE